MYKDFLKMDRQFESAVNLSLDLNKHKKIDEYIPTESSLKVLKEYLRDIDSDIPEKASVLIGPYGKGKSHLLLILAAITGMKRDDESNLKVLKRLVENIKLNDKDAGMIAERFIERRKRFMPVIINGGYSDLKQTFLLALKDALEREGITKLTPNTYYEVACKTIEMWKIGYPVTYDQFENVLSENKLSVESFKKRLMNYNLEAYGMFCDIHPVICAGAIFNPMINMDIVSMYKAVNEEICKQYNFKGMIVIFDEFSKFLENTKLHSPGELKVLQDFAEFANRTMVQQVHLLCITHKPIGYYTRDLSSERVMAYRTVEGRFKEIYFISSAEQNYQLIRNSIKRDEKKFRDYIKSQKIYFDELTDKAETLGIFPQGIDIRKEIIEGCFPLHPLTTFIAIRISELVAQNERTLFTFLAGHQHYTLRSFIKNYTDNKTLSADVLYDYFRECFQKEVNNENIITIFAQTEAILSKKCNQIQRKILKVMALVQMINQPNLIRVNDLLFNTSIEENLITVKGEIEELKRKHYIFKRNSDQVYICLNTSNVNLGNKINEYKRLQIKALDRKGILEKISPLGYTLPKQFNDEYHMIRFFKNEFMGYEELMTIGTVEEMLQEKGCDGVIAFLILNEEDSYHNLVKKIKELSDSRLIVYVPTIPFSIDEYLKEYVAIQLLKEDKVLIENDQPVLAELEIYETDVTQAIRDYVKNYFSLTVEGYRWISNADMQKVNSKMQLSSVLSEICRNIYFLTPVLANELINKHNISGAILTARNKLISNIINGEQLMVKGNSPDITIGRALIINKRIQTNETEDIGLISALDSIDQFINEADGKMQNIGCLYEQLQKAPYGMRKGVIPVYLAVYFKRYEEYLVVYNKMKEVEMNSETLRLIDREPHNYYIFLEEGTKEKIEYLNKLKDYFRVGNESLNFHTQCINIVEAIKIWFRSLPKCSREVQLEGELDEISKNFKKQIIKFDINAREFLFDILPNKVCKRETLDECVQTIQVLKNAYTEYYNELINKLIIDTKASMDKTYEGGLVGSLKNWYGQVEIKATEYVFDTQVNNFLEYIKNIEEYDEQKVICEIAHILTGLHIEDWGEKNIDEYKERLESIKIEFEQTLDNNSGNENTVQIILKTAGETKQKVVKIEEISPIGETLLSNLLDTLDEYGDAIETSEKRGIIIKMLENVM